MAKSSTSFTKGQSGNARGRPKGTSTKPLTDALRYELHREVKDAEDGKRRENRTIVARALVRKAKEGDVPDNTILDRVEGKLASNFGEDGTEFSLLEMIHHSYRLAEQRQAAGQAKLVEHKPLLEATSQQHDEKDSSE